MKKKIVRISAMLLIIPLWGGFFLFQHISRFDIFGDNPWHLYVLAILFTCLQHVMLYIAKKQSPPPGFFTFFGMAYIVALSYPTIGILLYRPRLMGLDVLGLCLDACNILLVLAWRRRCAGQPKAAGHGAIH